MSTPLVHFDEMKRNALEILIAEFISFLFKTLPAIESFYAPSKSYLLSNSFDGQHKDLIIRAYDDQEYITSSDTLSLHLNCVKAFNEL